MLEACKLPDCYPVSLNNNDLIENFYQSTVPKTPLVSTSNTSGTLIDPPSDKVMYGDWIFNNTDSIRIQKAIKLSDQTIIYAGNDDNYVKMVRMDSNGNYLSARYYSDSTINNIIEKADTLAKYNAHNDATGHYLIKAGVPKTPASTKTTAPTPAPTAPTPAPTAPTPTPAPFVPTPIPASAPTPPNQTQPPASTPPPPSPGPSSSPLDQEIFPGVSITTLLIGLGIFFLILLIIVMAM
jgi:hypothetical protein